MCSLAWCRGSNIKSLNMLLFTTPPSVSYQSKKSTDFFFPFFFKGKILANISLDPFLFCSYTNGPCLVGVSWISGAAHWGDKWPDTRRTTAFFSHSECTKTCKIENEDHAWPLKDNTGQLVSGIIAVGLTEKFSLIKELVAFGYCFYQATSSSAWCPLNAFPSVCQIKNHCVTRVMGN